ncbi:hypothetical protein BVRB_7g180660 [Beta vulgaris subsp. vulgaris]|uniref:Uncharacterized protein n=1 Tax=Beta vulgaris subsp. vulgaris TaxID=3555 RepID=A0A0J8BAE5_BETVV|nr:hypothetical protein BVRB_7g180660 [Beta vulgaris subsp. vulgaris]
MFAPSTALTLFISLDRWVWVIMLTAAFRASFVSQ